MSDTKARKIYSSQISTSKQRGIPFLLTFEEWWKIWDDSGHWHERGKGKDLYQMGRFGDQGPYAVGNVKIITLSENRQEEIENGGRERHSLVMSGRKHTKEHNDKIGQSVLGKPCSEIRKNNISTAAKLRWEKTGRCSLTEQDVLQIRASADRTKLVAEKFGVTQNTILNIRNRTSWKHLL